MSTNDFNLMSDKEAVEFTLRGPVPVQRYPQDNGDARKKTGCSLIDLYFQHPYQLGELVFTNYYTAFLSIYVKRQPDSKGHSHTREFSPRFNNPKSHLERSVTIDNSYGIGKTVYNGRNSQEEEEKFGPKEISQKVASSGLKRPNNTVGHVTLGSDLSDRPWECSIHMKTLMPWPHFELGSQDSCSIQVTESLVEWRDVVIMRLVIHQPSTVWKRFGVEDVNVFRNLPKRGFSRCNETSRQKDGWFSILKANTKKMLSGQLVEPETEKSDDRE